MLTASQAKTIADQLNPSLDHLLSVIQKRAEDGFYSLRCDYINSKQIKSLRELGYCIYYKRDEDLRATSYYIFW